MIAQIGVSHHHTPIELRERLSCSEQSLPIAYAYLKDEALSETVLLSTCNRMELYVASEGSAEHLHDKLIDHLARFHSMDASELLQHIEWRTEQEAADHLLRVASGLDSLVLGEGQILGQVRAAFQAAQKAGRTGRHLTRLFEQAIRSARRIQTETGLSRGGFSIGHAAVDMASRIFDDFAHARILILGAGKMSELTARHLVEKGVRFVMVANRTYERACELAQKLGGEAMRYDDAMQKGIVNADIVISSTAAPHPILNREHLLPLVKKRRGRPLFLIDIALPRDIDSDVNTLENVFLYNIDDLEAIVQQDASLRSTEVMKADLIVKEEIANYLNWRKEQRSAPLIQEIRMSLDSIREEYEQIFLPKFAHLSDRDRENMRLMLKSMMDKVAKAPIQALKQENLAGEFPELETSARLLFNLSQDRDSDLPMTENIKDNESKA